MRRHDFGDVEWRLFEPLLPKPCKDKRRVDDRRKANGMFYVLRTGAPWRDHRRTGDGAGCCCAHPDAEPVASVTQRTA